jgi:hypothetical protein
MGLNLEVLTLLLGSGVVCVMALGAAGVGASIALWWDPGSSDERQLGRERRALLVEMIAKVVLAFQLVSVVAFVAVADRLYPLFQGAMCAVGTLEAHPLGMPTLLVKLGVFVMCALWLILHEAAPSEESAELVRLKHGSLSLVGAALVTENILQLRFFSGLRPDIITSCCATVFNLNGQGIGSELAALPARESRAAYFLCLALTAAAGLRTIRHGRSPAAFSVSSLLLGTLALAALVSWIAPAVYELPTHHCPLCLLVQPHVLTGALLYSSLALGLVGGAGAGVVGLARRLDSAKAIRPDVESRLCACSLVGFGFFTVLGVIPHARLLFHQGGL